MRLYLLGPDITDNDTVCDLGALGDFVPVEKKLSVSSLDVPYALENLADIVEHALAPFQFIGNLHDVPVLPVLARFGADKCVHHYRL